MLSYFNFLLHYILELRDLLSKMLEPDKDRRIDLSGILVHPWVSEKGKNPVLPSTPDILTHDMRQSVSGSTFGGG